jgi:hypothetical protein
MKRSIDTLTEEEKLEVFLEMRKRLKHLNEQRKIGNVVYFYNEHGIYHGTTKVSTEDSEETQTHPVADMYSKLHDADAFALGKVGNVCDYIISSKGTIQINSDSVDFYETKNLADLIRKYGSPACFGDMATNTTVLDTTVRDAIQVKEFVMECDGKPAEEVLLKEINSHSSEFNPFAMMKDVRIVPHALNLYSQGGHFDWHLDTQRSPDMVGTITILLGEYKDGYLLVKEGPDSKSHHSYVPFTPWRNDPKGFRAVAMLASCPHKVNPVTEGLRISVTFDVLGKITEAEKFHDEFIEDAKKYASENKIPYVGIVLSHMYTADDMKNGLYRNSRDASLVRIAGEKGTCIHAYWNRDIVLSTAGFDEDYMGSNYLFSFEPSDGKYADALVFGGYFEIEENGLKLTSEKQPMCEHTGNEAREGYDRAVYRLTVLMIEV